MSNDDRGKTAMPPSDSFVGLRGEAILTMKVDQFGNIGIYAPTLPPARTCKILAQALVDIIFTSMEQSRIIKPLGGTL